MRTSRIAFTRQTRRRSSSGDDRRSGRLSSGWLPSRGKQIMVANTDHMIPLEQPEAVIAALHDVIEQARKSSH